MIHERDLEILKRLRKATIEKSMMWSESDDGWYTSTIGGREISFRFLYFEATNQPGADRHIIEFVMPGRNARFACGTEGFDVLMEIVAEAFAWVEPNEFDPIKFLNDNLPDSK